MVAALMGYLLQHNKTLLIVCGYRAQNPLFLDGWPQSPGHYATTLKTGGGKRGGNKGKGKGKSKGKQDAGGTAAASANLSPRGLAGEDETPSSAPVPYYNWKQVFTQNPTEANGLNMRFKGLRQRCPELFTKKLISLGTVDSFQGGEAHVVIFATTRSNDQHKLGFIDCPKRVNVALSRGLELNLVTANGHMLHNAVESKMNLLSAAARAGGYWLRLADQGQAGNRDALVLDKSFDPIADLAGPVANQRTPEDNVRMQVDDDCERRAREAEATRVQFAKALSLIHI